MAGGRAAGRRALPHVTVGLFGLLVLGGVALSLASAPAVAVTELHTAARATLAASGFDLTDTNTATPSGPSGGERAAVVIRVRYQAPDAVEETGPDASGRQVTVLVVGDRRFGKVGSRWAQLPPEPGLGAQAAATFLLPLRAAASASRVTGGPTSFTLVPAHESDLVTRLLGRAPAGLAHLVVTAEVQGGVLTDEHLRGMVGAVRLDVDLAL
ncbi:MAG TPA: hypothetical protein VMB72_16750, partial [Acidimicrobiales bacterium]|nr:hypothetical protein [Acidimicrobiales bacterium]